MRLVTLFATFGMLLSGIALGSGWECEGKDSTYEVRLYNKVSTAATKTPAVLLVTRNGELVGLAKGDQIDMETAESSFPGTKTPSGQMKIYTVKKFEAKGEALENLKGLTLKVNGNPDAEKIEYNQERAGLLQIESARGVEQKLSCYYYLKGERQKTAKKD